MGKNREEPKEHPIVTDGTVEIQFDAGGPGLSVGPNPVRAAWADQAQSIVQVIWRLKDVRNIMQGWTVLLGNVVPCDCEQLPPTMLDSGPRDSGNLWVWRFPWDSHREDTVTLPYELFIVYRPEQVSTSLQTKPSQPIEAPPRLLGLREVIGLDPTVLLPPRQGPGLGIL
jgi:hypothetical protein